MSEIAECLCQEDRWMRRLSCAGKLLPVTAGEHVSRCLLRFACLFKCCKADRRALVNRYMPKVMSCMQLLCAHGCPMLCICFVHLGWGGGGIGHPALSTCSSPGSAWQQLCLQCQVQEEGAVGVSASQTIWMPMEYNAQAQWRWLDWARFYFYRCTSGPRTDLLCITAHCLNK